KAAASDLVAAGDAENGQIVFAGKLGNGAPDSLKQRPFRQVHLEYRVEIPTQPALQTHRHGERYLGIQWLCGLIIGKDILALVQGPVQQTGPASSGPYCQGIRTHFSPLSSSNVGGAPAGRT